MHPQLLRGEDHQQRFAAALEMPDQALLWITLHHAVDDLVGGEILLVTADDLDAAVLLVRGEQREVLQDVEHDLGPEHALDCRLHVVQLTFRLVLLRRATAPTCQLACGWSRSGTALPSVAKEKTFGTNMAGTCFS